MAHQILQEYVVAFSEIMVIALELEHLDPSFELSIFILLELDHLASSVKEAAIHVHEDEDRLESLFDVFFPAG